MIGLSELTTYINTFLDSEQFSDYAPNGLQIEGRPEVKKLCTAVTASMDVITQAISLGADALLVHHGYFWRGEDPTITGTKARRIAALLKQDISLLAYHLPLDCHADFGNNACIGKLLNVEAIEKHKAGGTSNLLWSGTLPKPLEKSECQALLQKQFQRLPLSITTHDRPIQSLAWCSGAAQDFIEQAKKLGVDAFLSGEVSERTWYQARELEIDYFACGHHATERFGVQALGAHLSSKFGLEHLFIDSENPI